MHPVHCSAAAQVAKLPVAGSSVLLGRATLCARGRRPTRESSAPRASLGASSRSPARPPHLRTLARPALAPLIPAPTPNFACNSPMTASSFEFRSLELQRFQTLLKLLPIELHATFVEDRPWRTAWGIGLVDTLHGRHRHFQRASTKEISPQQGTPPLVSRLQ